MTTDTALSLTITRHFAASPGQVFDAWLTETWSKWIGPRDIRSEVTLHEPKVGGRYRILMHRPDGVKMAVSGIYRTIERPSKLVFTWKWDDGASETLVTLTFRAAGKGTDMTLLHEGFPDADRRDRHVDGWNNTLGKLVELLAKGAMQ